MNKTTSGSRTFDEYLGCFGNFIMEDRVCRTMCALRLRCAVERDQNARMEIMAEMVASTEDMSVKVH